MKISGTATMHAPAGRVWTALRDPAVLAAAIPGCERLEPTGTDTYRFSLTAGLASIRGTYSGDIALTDQREPSSFVLTASGAGGTGSASTSVLIRLAPLAGGDTELTYDADAEVGGLIASVGQLMLATVARRLADDFFSSVDDVLSGNDAGTARPAPAGSGGTGPDAAKSAVYLPLPRSPGFGAGLAVGAAAALAGVAAGRLLGRRND
jgi:uncharacterized protein